MNVPPLPGDDLVVRWILESLQVHPVVIWIVVSYMALAGWVGHFRWFRGHGGTLVRVIAGRLPASLSAVASLALRLVAYAVLLSSTALFLHNPIMSDNERMASACGPGFPRSCGPLMARYWPDVLQHPTPWILQGALWAALFLLAAEVVRLVSVGAATAILAIVGTPILMLLVVAGGLSLIVLVLFVPAAIIYGATQDASFEQVMTEWGLFFSLLIAGALMFGSAFAAGGLIGAALEDTA